MYPDHWVALTSNITDRGIVDYDGLVNLTIYTWGSNMSVPASPDRPLSKRSSFKDDGFIAARP